MSSLAEAIKPSRAGCAPVGARLKGKKSKGEVELPEFISPPPKNAQERREWVRLRHTPPTILRGAALTSPSRRIG